MHKLVAVEWEDSRQPTSAWQFLEDIEERAACLCLSVGYLVHEGNGSKTLAANLADIQDPEGVQASGVITIPESCIKKVTELTPVTCNQQEGPTSASSAFSCQALG